MKGRTDVQANGWAQVRSDRLISKKHGRTYEGIYNKDAYAVSLCITSIDHIRRFERAAPYKTPIHQHVVRPSVRNV